MKKRDCGSYSDVLDLIDFDLEIFRVEYKKVCSVSDVLDLIDFDFEIFRVEYKKVCSVSFFYI